MTDDTRELYVVVATALVPSQATQTIAARDVEHAKEIMRDKHKQYNEFQIVDAFKLKDCPEITQSQATNKQDKKN